MIQLIELRKAFEDKKVLKGIDTIFEAGKTNLIIGQSGSGKTVLMKCIVGLFSLRWSRYCNDVQKRTRDATSRNGNDISKCSFVR